MHSIQRVRLTHVSHWRGLEPLEAGGLKTAVAVDTDVDWNPRRWGAVAVDTDVDWNPRRWGLLL